MDESWWCVINVTWLFIITLHWTVTNWSSLETCLQSARWFKVRADLNMLNHLKVIWSTKPIWNISIIWYFSSFIHFNNRRSIETLVGIMIQTSDLHDGRWARYQLSYAASLKIGRPAHAWPEFFVISIATSLIHGEHASVLFNQWTKLEPIYIICVCYIYIYSASHTPHSASRAY